MHVKWVVTIMHVGFDVHIGTGSDLRLTWYNNKRELTAVEINVNINISGE